MDEGHCHLHRRGGLDSSMTQESSRPHIIDGSDRRGLAEELKRLFQEISPFIETHTTLVCPECPKVCCINRHSFYSMNDIIFLSALGEGIYPYTPDRKETDPCRHMSKRGCSLKRWKRPYRCTFYFCEPLLESFSQEKPRLYREFIYSYQQLTLVRGKLLA